MPALIPGLLAWYRQNGRILPWRGHPDPYAVWVSEIMLQQTQVETVIPYFEKWMRLFPSMAELAAAPERAVLNAWEGLGYYSRARNLHKAAKIVVAEYGGQLPADVEALRRLPGIGRYTAGAIASLCFGRDEPALDGNLKRVLARLFNVTEPVDAPTGEKLLWQLAADNLPPGQAGDYNQALMDLGALVCTPISPNCAACPVSAFCRAYRNGTQAERPVRAARPPQPHYTVTAAVIRRNGKVLLAQRPQNGLLGGLWEFPGGKQEPGESLAECLAREIREELGAEVEVRETIGEFRHAYTHFKITLHAFECRLLDGEPRPVEAQDVRWVELSGLGDFPMGKVDRQIALQLTTEK
jgi:A/G-specific adenine glycosylase